MLGASLRCLSRIPPRVFAHGYKRPVKAQKKQIVLKNADIGAPSLSIRLIWEDGSKGEQSAQNEVMALEDAINIAKKQGLDVVQVNGNSKPAVCRVEDAGKVLMEKKKKAKALRSSNRAKSVKEMVVGGGIDTHDLEMKMNKVKDFLADGHSVRVQVLAKRGNLQKNPRAVADTTLKVLDALDGHVGQINQSNKLSQPNSNIFTVNPK